MRDVARVVWAALLCLSGLRASAVDVRAFGAKGDGVADDTAAIQRAADAVFAKQGVRPPQVTRHWTTGWDCPEEELFFPRGTYRITGPVLFQGNVMLRGERGSLVRNDNPRAMTFFFSGTLRVAMRGLGFSGGSVQLHHWTANADTATFLVSDCTFSGATETSIVSLGWNENGKMVVPYDVMRAKDGRVALEPWSAERTGRLKSSPNSTSIIVERCRFEGMARAVRMASDGIIIRGCEFVATSAKDTAVLDLATVANVMRSTIHVAGETKEGQCAIRFRGAQNVATRLMITSEDDLPAFECAMTPRAHYAVPKMSLTEIALDTGCAPVVRFPPKKLAQMIVVNRLMRVNRTKWRVWRNWRAAQPVFSFAEVPTAADVAEWSSAKTISGRTCKIPPLPPEECFSISLARIDDAAFDPSLPEALKPFVRNARADLRRGYEERHAPVAECWPEIRGEGLGSDRPDSGGDDTETLRSLFARAAEMKGATVVLPSKWLRIRGPLAIPPMTHVTAHGRAFLTSVNDDQPVFTVADATDIRLENVAVVRGRNAVRVTANAGLVRCRNCYFYDQLGPSIAAKAPKSSLRIEVTGGIAYTPYLYDGNAKPMLVDGAWYSTAPNRPKGENEPTYSAMVNRTGGRLLLYDVLGVPCYFGNIPMERIEDDGVATVGDYRWVENHGDLRIVNSRIGGEWNGLTIAYGFGDAATTYIEGGVDACMSRWLRGGKAHVVVDRPNAEATFVDATGFDYFGTARSPLAVVIGQDGRVVSLEGTIDLGSFPFAAKEVGKR